MLQIGFARIKFHRCVIWHYRAAILYISRVPLVLRAAHSFVAYAPADNTK